MPLNTVSKRRAQQKKYQRMNKLRVSMRSDWTNRDWIDKFVVFFCLSPKLQFLSVFFLYSNLGQRRPESCEQTFAQNSINRRTLAPDNNVLNNKKMKCVHLIWVTVECVLKAFNIKWNCWRGHYLTSFLLSFLRKRDSLVRSCITYNFRLSFPRRCFAKK